MAFGQSSGPPATGKQVAELLALVQAAGHRDFREARGPLGLNQRQAAGKFTRVEADEYITPLQDAEHGAPEADAAAAAAPPARPRAVAAAPPSSPTSPPARPSGPEAALRKLPSSMLAAELQRRGWVVMEP
jgi:hypothetical protein